jgi:hypothetical protein
LPSIISHAVVGIVAGKTFADAKMPKRFWLLSIVYEMGSSLEI